MTPSRHAWIQDTAPITATDAEIEAFLAEAELPPLLPALAQLTGDLSILDPALRPDPTLGMVLPQGGLRPDQQEAIRALALERLVAYRDSGCRPAPTPSPDDLRRIMEFTVGSDHTEDYVPLLTEELALGGEDGRAPQWTLPDLAGDRRFEVAIIGAGMSGLLAAHRLQQAGVSFTVLEKNPDVGGTWFENGYPGCRVDNPNHNYSYSFAQRHDWPFHFSTQDVLHRYFSEVADHFDLRRHVRFGTEVVSAVWSDDERRWTVTVRDGHGPEQTITVDAVISAVGQLNRPLMPDIAGQDDFAGPSFHTARWNSDVDLTGKRVGVIGTGASAMQCIPEIAGTAAEVVVFQRTPAWLAPTGDYHDEVSAGQRWLYAHVPFYSEWNRFWIFWRMGDGALQSVRVDPDWDRSTGSVGPGNAMFRALLENYLSTEFADRPDLLAHVMPSYPPGAKRVIRDNGVWAATLKRANVKLVTDDIDRIKASGVATTDGTVHDVDVIVYGTGFQASRFLTPMQVKGAGGVDLHERWGDEASAYLGITVPGFPNLFCLYGPNTNIVINGSIIYFSECGVRYILGCIEALLAGGTQALDVKESVHGEFRDQVDAENRSMAWGVSEVNTWYKSSTGRVTQNWPFTLLEYWQRTLRPDLDDYVVLPVPARAPV